MENLHPPTGQEQRQFIALLMFSLVLSSVFLLFDETTGDLKGAVPPGRALLMHTTDEAGRSWGEPVQEWGPMSLEKIRINSSSEAELQLCPGIGPVIANKMIRERSVRPFSSWEDLSERIPGFGRSRVTGLQEAGVKLHDAP
jgi:hypothetical protein